MSIQSILSMRSVRPTAPRRRDGHPVWLHAGLLVLWAAGAGALFARDGVDRAPPDPGLQVFSPRLTAEELPRVRALFDKLRAEDFAVREGALAALVARGPAVLPLAEEYAKSADQEQAAQAQGLLAKVLLNYQGYWPPSLGLLTALERPCKWQPPAGTLGAKLESLAKAAGLRIFVDPAVAQAGNNAELSTPGAWEGSARSLTESVVSLSAPRNCEPAVGFAPVSVQRGDCVLVTTGATAERLRRCRQTFAWRDLNLDRDEAQRVAGELHYLLGSDVELHTGSENLSVHGPPECVPRVARLLALLHPDAPAAQWPAPAQPVDAGAAVAVLAKPATVALDSSDIQDALAGLKKQGHHVTVLSEGREYAGPPYPVALQGLSPITLSLKDVPLGHVLRWLVRRMDFPGEERNRLAVHPETGEAGRVTLRIGPKQRELSGLTIGGGDASFLTRGQGAPAQADETARKRLLEALQPHLDLFPDFIAETDLRVVRGRMLVQGGPALVAHALGLLRQWHDSGQQPACPWQKELLAKLDKPVTWDGRDLTGGKVLRRLRELGRVTLLLENSPDGEPGSFQLTRQQAALLPPGEYTLRALLDDLAAKAGARWEVRWGVVTLVPAPKGAQRNRN